jgi:hypothetical protein
LKLRTNRRGSDITLFPKRKEVYPLQQQDFQDFNKGLENYIQLIFSSTLQQCEASEQVVTNTLQSLEFRTSDGKHDLRYEPFEIKLRVNLPLQKNQLLQLCILSWWMPPITKFELQEFLRKSCRQNLNFFDYQIYLNSKELCLAALFLETHVSKRTLFGNILTGKYMLRQKDSTGRKLVSKHKLKVLLEIELHKKPRKKEYRRGYNDHGSLPPTDEVNRRKVSEDISTSLHLELEKKRVEAKIQLLSLQNKLVSFLGTG